MKHPALFVFLGIFFFSFVLKTNAAPTIVGGTPATAGEFPHMVSIGYRNDSNGYNAHFCGGSLIKSNWVLTAAHCVTGETAGQLAVIINRIDLRQTSGEKINVKRILVHANYDSNTLDNDIAVLELERASQQGTVIVPVLSSNTGLNAAGAIAWVTGWGDTTDGGAGSPTLLKVDAPLVSNSTCSNAMGNGITANMICAGTTNGGKDSCQNDSGGPLVTKDSNGTWRQVGVVSWGFGCAQPGTYGVYAKASQYTDWLEARVGKLTSPTTPPISELTNKVYLPIVVRP